MTKPVNKTKLVVIIAVVSMTLLSLIVAKIMSNNYQKDDTKIRFELTQDYKEYKDLDYTYDQEKGQKLYRDLCAKCHGNQGQGNIQFPSLQNAAVLADQEKLLKIVLFGLQGELKRADKTYNSIMPGLRAIGHDDLAHVINFVRQEYDENKEIIHPIEIVKSKIDNLTQKAPYKTNELFIESEK